MKSQTGAYAAGGTGPTVDYAYHANGLVRAVTNPLGGTNSVVSYGYDSRGNRTSRSASAILALGASAVAVTEGWAYNASDQVVRHTDQANYSLPDTDSTKRVTQVTYDGDFGRVWKVEQGFKPAGGTQDGRIRTLTYSNSGNVASEVSLDRTTNASVEVYRWFDGHGRLTRSTAPRSQTGLSEHGPQDVDYRYDTTGRLIEMTIPDPYVDPTKKSTTTWSYDLTDSVVDLTYRAGSKVRTTRDRTGAAVATATKAAGSTLWLPVSASTYDAEGKLRTESVIGRGSREWTYAANGSGKVVEYDQTVNSTPTMVTNTSLTWRDDGRLESEAQANATNKRTWYGYDPAGQLTCRSIETDNPATTGVAEQNTSDCPATAPSDCANNPTGTLISQHRYVYDPRGVRLCQAAATTVTRYHSRVNGQHCASTTGTGTFDCTTAAGSGVTRYSYDGDGRQTLVDNGSSGSITSAYDARGLAMSIGYGTANCSPTETACNHTETRDYDGEGRMVWAGVGGGGLNLTWDPTVAVPQIIEARLNGNVWSQMLYGNNRYQVDATTNGGTSNTGTFHAYDWQGNTIDTPDTYAPESYDPFGTASNGQFSFYFGYRGELEFSGNIHLRARDYRPAQGTFTTRDPLDGVPGTTTEAHPYHYTDNDPLNLSDPLGLRPSDCVFFGRKCTIIVDDFVADRYSMTGSSEDFDSWKADRRADHFHYGHHRDYAPIAEYSKELIRAASDSGVDARVVGWILRNEAGGRLDSWIGDTTRVQLERHCRMKESIRSDDWNCNPSRGITNLQEHRFNAIRSNNMDRFGSSTWADLSSNPALSISAMAFVLADADREIMAHARDRTKFSVRGRGYARREAVGRPEGSNYYLNSKNERVLRRSSLVIWAYQRDPGSAKRIMDNSALGDATGLWLMKDGAAWDEHVGGQEISLTDSILCGSRWSPFEC